MDRIADFDATISDDGTIRVPDSAVRALHGKSVHVTLDDNEPPTPISLQKGKRMTKLVKRMIEQPFQTPGFKPASRDQIYDRSA